MAHKLHRDDLLEATLSWVFGELLKLTIFPNGPYWGQFNDEQGKLHTDKFHEFCLRTHAKVWHYLWRIPNQGPGADCGDTEADLVLKARRIFEHHLMNNPFEREVLGAALGLSFTQAHELMNSPDGYRGTSASDFGKYILSHRSKESP